MRVSGTVAGLLCRRHALGRHLRRLLSTQSFTAWRNMLLHPQFDPIALRIGPVAIHWYGLMYLLGFALVYLLGRMRLVRGHTPALQPRDLEDLIFYSVLGVVLGGRLGYVLFYKPAYYLEIGRASCREGVCRRECGLS